MNIQETAVAYHTNGCNCAQSVLMALQNETGLDEDTSRRVATGFGGGVQITAPADVRAEMAAVMQKIAAAHSAPLKK